MASVHREALRGTLTVTPDHGGRPFEEAYRPMAEARGKDWPKEAPV